MIGQEIDQNTQGLRQSLEEHGYRYTEQRSAVYRFLACTDSHPTAEAVHLHVRDELPTISLGTVYKSLETLVDCGLVQKLTYSDGSSRYDGRTDPHHHARCLACGKVEDIPETVSSLLPESMGHHPGFKMTGYRLELTGYCAGCA